MGDGWERGGLAPACLPGELAHPSGMRKRVDVAEKEGAGVGRGCKASQINLAFRVAPSPSPYPNPVPRPDSPGQALPLWQPSFVLAGMKLTGASPRDFVFLFECR